MWMHLRLAPSTANSTLHADMHVLDWNFVQAIKDAGQHLQRCSKLISVAYLAVRLASVDDPSPTGKYLYLPLLVWVLEVTSFVGFHSVWLQDKRVHRQ